MRKFILSLALLIAGTTIANAQVDIERAKAKFIYNFTNFFEWPASERSGDFVIGVIGSGELYRHLDNYTQGKKVIVQDISVKKFSDVNEATDCHVLFISKHKSGELENLTKGIKNNTLLISDSRDGIDQGAALNFVLMGNRLKYEFAASNAMESGLKFSSRIRDMAAKNH